MIMYFMRKSTPRVRITLLSEVSRTDRMSRATQLHQRRSRRAPWLAALVKVQDEVTVAEC